MDRAPDIGGRKMKYAASADGSSGKRWARKSLKYSGPNSAEPENGTLTNPISKAFGRCLLIKKERKQYPFVRQGLSFCVAGNMK